jgi:UDP-N-acetylglucosamine/UDP-N-acetylgalactosamine diphosphorylase
MHTYCFKCEHCKRQLTLGNFAAVNQVFYCKTHFVEIFKKAGGKYDVFKGHVPANSEASIAAAASRSSSSGSEALEDTEDVSSFSEISQSETPKTETPKKQNEEENQSFTVPLELRERYEKAYQAEVFRFIDSGLVSEQEEVSDFLTQLREIPVESLQNIYNSAMNGAAKGEVAPVQSDILISLDEKSQEERSGWYTLGLEEVAKGHVAVVILAGGQGTRLGFDGPKGKFNIGLFSNKSLFQLQAERILAVQRLAKTSKPVPLYIMTSPLNDAETREFFSSLNNFGLDSANVFFFAQGTLPCMTDQVPGKIILESKTKVATAPDGNGGVFTSLRSSGALADMNTRGVKWIHVVSVDNALVQMADPLFIGCCKTKGAQVGNKTVKKISWDEPVGVMAIRDGKCQVVEYSELDKSVAASVDEQTGSLLFGSASICNHLFSFEFIRDANLENSYHIARKKIPFADPETGITTHPTSNNGVKLELFVFDVFTLADSMTVIEVSSFLFYQHIASLF